MKLIIFCFVFCFSNLYLVAQDYTKEGYPYRLKGPVHEVTEYVYSTQELYDRNEHDEIWVIKFNEDGNLISDTRRRVGKEAGYIEEIEYDKLNRIIEYNKLLQTKTTERRTYKYPAANKRIVLSYRNDEFLNTNYQTFDKMGNKTEQIVDNEKYVSKYKYQYNPSNGKLETQHSYRDDSLIMKKTYFYSDELKTKEETYHPNGEIKSSMFYEYDERMNLIKFTSIREDGSKRVSYNNYVYSEDFYEKTSPKTEGRFGIYIKYDSEGNMLHEIFSKEDGSVHSDTKYELDKYGNWIKQIYEAESHFGIRVRARVF